MAVGPECICIWQPNMHCSCAALLGHYHWAHTLSSAITFPYIGMWHGQVCWSDDGERFAGLGDGGVVATWRLDAPRMQASDTGYLGRSDWCHQVSPHSNRLLCCAVLCCAVLCCAVRCGAVRCGAVLCGAVLCCAVRCCAVLCWRHFILCRAMFTCPWSLLTI